MTKASAEAPPPGLTAAAEAVCEGVGAGVTGGVDGVDGVAVAAGEGEGAAVIVSMTHWLPRPGSTTHRLYAPGVRSGTGKLTLKPPAASVSTVFTAWLPIVSWKC